MIVDSHIHLYPPSVYANPDAWAEAMNEPYWLACVHPQEAPRLQAWATVDRLLEQMDAAEVDKAIIQGWYWENHHSCEENTRWQIDWIRAHPDRLIAFAPFNPNGGQRSLDILRLAFDTGFRGIGELNPPAQGYDYQDPLLGQAIELCRQAQGAVTFHLTDPNSRPYPGKIETPFPELLALARNHPQTNFIFAHLGGMLPLQTEEPIPPNVWYDTAAVPLLYAPSSYLEFQDKVGSERILFGSDFPLRVFPKSEKSPDFTAPIQQIRDCGLSEPDLIKILGSNTATLLSLPANDAELRR